MSYKSGMKKTAKPHKPSSQPVPVAAHAAQHDGTAAFLREVDEALQQERLLNLWHTYKWMLVGGVLAVLLAVSAWQGWGAWRQHQARTQAANWYALSAISADTTRKEALTKFLTHSTGGYRALAAFTQADATPVPAEKAKSYALVYNDKSLPQWLREVARLNAAIVLLGVDDAAAKSQLEVLTQNNGETPGPAYAAALELMALQSQRLGDVMAARGYTEKLLNQTQLTPDMRQRALQRMGAYSTLAQ